MYIRFRIAIIFPATRDTLNRAIIAEVVMPAINSNHILALIRCTYVCMQTLFKMYFNHAIKMTHL